MAHLSKALCTATVLNTAVLGAEVIAGVSAGSLALVADGVHNLSDEMGLVLLWLASMLRHGLSRTAVRWANLVNSAGLIAVSIAIIVQAFARLSDPGPVLGLVPVTVGLAAALGNWSVARVLEPWAQTNPAIRLAYLHNRGDVLMSGVPILAGVLVLLTGQPMLDPALAILVALWIIVTTLREVLRSRQELLWPEAMTSGSPAEPPGRADAGGR